MGVDMNMASFRAVLFRMVPKLALVAQKTKLSFRAVLFRMVPKRRSWTKSYSSSFRAVLFRMVPKQELSEALQGYSFEWFQN